MGINSFEEQRHAIATRLRARRLDIEQTALTRTFNVSPGSEGVDPHYLDGLRLAVEAAVEYGFASVERGEVDPPSVPAPLRSQARLAARSEVPLDTVLRRCLAGFTLFSNAILEEGSRGRTKPSTLQRVMREQALLFDRLIDAITGEYSDEKKILRGGAEQREAEGLQRLLDGELIDLGQFRYDFDGKHVALIGVGEGAHMAIRNLAIELNQRLLLVHPKGERMWGWLGSRREVDWDDLQEKLQALPDVPLAVGEPSEGLIGWRLSHEQAKAALPIALRRGEVVRYSGVALLASLLQDDLLSASLRKMYLEPFRNDRDGGHAVRETLRAYFAAGRNASSAAAALGVSRRTITNRLRSIEIRLHRPLASSITEIEAALLLEETRNSSESVSFAEV